VTYRRLALGYGTRLAFIGAVTWLGARVLARGGLLTTDTAAAMAVVGYVFLVLFDLTVRYIFTGGLE